MIGADSFENNIIVAKKLLRMQLDHSLKIGELEIGAGTHGLAMGMMLIVRSI